MPLRQERTLDWQLIKLGLGLSLPTLLFVAVLLWQFLQSEQRRVEEEARGLSRGLAVALDREINGVVTTLQALGTSPSLQAGDHKAFYDQAAEVSRLQGLNISLRDAASGPILTTRVPFGTALTQTPVLSQADAEVLRTRKAVVTNVFTSTVSGIPVFQIVEGPVSVGGLPKYFVSASLDIDYLANAIRQEHLPPGWIGALVDRNNVFVARTERHSELVGKNASASFRDNAVGLGGTYYGSNSDGTEVLVGYARSQLTGWLAGANLSQEALDAPRRQSLFALLGLGLFLGTMAAVFAWWNGRRLARDFHHLTNAAAALGLGKAVPPMRSRIREINQVALALQRAARQREAAEAALSTLNNRLEDEVAQRTRERNRLWETTNDLVGTGTFGGYLKSVNPAWTNALGWSEDELLSRPFVEIVEPADREVLADIVAKLRSGETITDYVNRVLTKDGAHRTIMWSAVPFTDDGMFYLVGRDLTEQRHAEEVLRQTQKIEAVGQLTGGIAHDFNNMLAVIIGGLNLLQRRLARGERDVSKYIEGALDGATRAAALTHRLLAFSRQQALAPEAIDANKLVGGMTELLTRTLGEQTRVETVLSAGLWKAKADPNQLENVILNLGVNARDAMPDGGRLTIETANSHLDSVYGGENGVQPGQYVLISVTDTGIGMSPDIVSRAFDPFFTTKAVGKGTGLGLSQVFGFARQSGGHVKIYSEIGHGTTVKLYLPRFYGPIPQPAQREPAIPAEGGSAREIVLVVEDEERVRNFAVDALRELGYSVIHASTGTDALDLIKAGQDVALLFTDIVMPAMTGRQLVDAAAAIRPGLKVLYTTGYSRNAVVHNGILDPGTNLLAKPFTMDQLATAVRHALNT